MTEHICTIKLLRQSYQIKCPEQEEQQLQLAAEKLNQATLSQKNKFRHIDDFQALMLAALNISHELIQHQHEHQKHQHQMNDLIQSLEQKISKVVEED